MYPLKIIYAKAVFVYLILAASEHQTEATGQFLLKAVKSIKENYPNLV